MAQYLDPKVDYVFKKIFGSVESGEVLLSFLNGILYEGEERITAVQIQNPYLPGETDLLKETYVDVRATLSDGAQIIIEMQMAPTRAFGRRLMYNSGKLYTSQLEQGIHYNMLWPTYTLAVTNFVFVPEHPHYLSRFVLREVWSGVDFPEADFLQFWVLELPKFDKALHQLDSRRDLWSYFLNHAHQLQEVPREMTKDTAVAKAFDIANKANLTPQELIELEKRAKYVHEEQMRLDYALERGFQQGIEQGLEQGIEKGIEQGLEKGEQLALQRTILNILQLRFGSIPLEITAQLEQASVEKLREFAPRAAVIESVEVFLAEIGA